eukprot:CAMPEP_0168626148 /NCGR_PEP_ID=MMETSP0449_2-20121227/10455_1 /TAXON_ID=1082188 /ORGANISM="Strombidium rassoulzadegani, Strain ras09" /LENGTH=113 /DNA_ID=CAMNT_0008668079 /DNA_START=89 /DNA_END=427 /DNA_ORIENTATION=+
MALSDGESKVANIHSVFLCFMRVVEIEMSFSFLIYFIQVEMTSYHEFSFIFSCVLVGLTFVFTFAHSLPEKTDAQKNRKLFLKLVCKITNVALTVLGFFQIFISDLYFDIGED